MAFTKWWVGSGVELELRALFRTVRAPEATLVSLWADHDLGGLDLCARLMKRRLIGVFHACPDDLPMLIPDAARLKAFSRVILMSQCQEQFFLDRGVPRHRIQVLLHGVETDYFRPAAVRRSQRDRNEQFRVLSIGTQRRDFEALARICRAMRGHKTVRITIVAPPRIQEYFRDCDNVTILSGVSDAKLLELYQQSDCFIQTLSHATANNTLLEAMSCGLPVIATAVGGVAEYVPDNCGKLLSGDLVSNAQAALETWLQDTEAYDNASIAARSWAESLDWGRVADRWREILEASD